MSLKRLAIRTKKSLSGLYSSTHDENHAPVPHHHASGSTPITPERAQPGFEESDEGVITSPTSHKNSPSRRKKLLGSLRDMGSLRSLRSQYNSSKTSDESPIKPESPHTPMHARPSLALNFEVSPPDKPMFESPQNGSNSSLDVQPSSPITVPSSARQTTAHCAPSYAHHFQVGTVPDSPAPLQKALADDLTQSAGPSPERAQDLCNSAKPMITPMPGTNLTFEDIATPSILVSSPSMAREEHEQEYFGRSAIDRSVGNIDNVLATNGSKASNEKHKSSQLTGPGKPSESTDNETESSQGQQLKPMSSIKASTSDVNDDPFVLDMSTRSSSKVIENNEGQADDLASFVPEEAIGTHMRLTNERLRKNSAFSDDSFKSSRDEKLASEFSYLMWSGPNTGLGNNFQLKQHASTWSRHTCLYDGTGYGNESRSAPTIHTSPNSVVIDEDNMTSGIAHEEEASEPNIGRIASKVKRGSGLSQELKQRPDYEVMTRSATQTASPLSIKAEFDEHDALQEIIRAYAAPMLYQEEARQMQAAPLDATTGSAPNDDVALSYRIMNRSLGG